MTLPSPLKQLLQGPKQQNWAVLLALLGLIPGLPCSGIHKFYLGQPGWGAIYLALFLTPIPHIASAVEAIWYLCQPRSQFEARFNGGQVVAVEPQSPLIEAQSVQAIATALRELEQLRQDGLLSDYEFEQKRRQLVDKKI